MHEMSLSRSMLTIIQEQAADRGFHRVSLVRLEIGALSCVATEALAFCFESVTRGTLAEGAILDMVTVPGRAWCWDCATDVDIDQRGAACPGCGGYSLEVRSGDQMKIKELEVE